jgi:hypothetical protein
MASIAPASCAPRRRSWSELEMRAYPPVWRVRGLLMISGWVTRIWSF